MKTKITYLLSALGMSAATALTMSACRDYDVFDVDKATVIKLAKEYEAAFIDSYGKPDPNHDWGMDEKIGAIEGLSSANTRAGQVMVNRNQWTEFDNNSKHTVSFPYYGTNTPNVQVPNYKTSALGHDIQIPGFPHLNGLYYTIKNGVLDETYRTGEQITSGMIPAGDVTPYEIQYVSAWFRTHKNPVSNVKLHLSDFFIQNVSCDYDQVTYDALGAPYQEGWPETGRNGKNIGSISEASSHKAFDGTSYIKDNNLTEPISYDLDYLGFEDMNGVWTHVNNFNRGNSNFSPEDSKSNPNREIQFIKSSGTEDFSCHPSWCTDTDTIKTWVLVHLTWIETVKHDNSPYTKGTQIPREGYYLAFDFHGKKNGSQGMQEVVRDGYYSNWIVKITPTYFTATGNSRRIFCEDLGGSFDFDFNDAVVDVAFEQKGNQQYEPIICIQAAGGTMPIYIEHKDDKHELHKLFNADVTTPVNVEEKTQRPTAIYRGNVVSEDKIGKIKIYVHNTNNNEDYELIGKGDTPDDRTDNLNDENYNNKNHITPFAFSAPTSVKWLKELKSIHTAYKEYPNWVKNKEYTGANGAKWYENITNGENLLYSAAFKQESGIYHNPTPSAGGFDTPISWAELTPDPDASTVVSGVKADSYMKLNGYTGVDAIIEKLNIMGDNDRITFVVVLSSANEFITNGTKLQGVLVPADINGISMSNNGISFPANNLSRFNSAVYVPENIEFDPEKTYTLQFSFAKSDIVRAGGGYHDYLLLFLKVGDNEAGTGTTMGENNGVTIRKWYVHY